MANQHNSMSDEQRTPAAETAKVRLAARPAGSCALYRAAMRRLDEARRRSARRDCGMLRPEPAQTEGRNDRE